MGNKEKKTPQARNLAPSPYLPFTFASLEMHINRSESSSAALRLGAGGSRWGGSPCCIRAQGSPGASSTWTEFGCSPVKRLRRVGASDGPIGSFSMCPSRRSLPTLRTLYISCVCLRENQGTEVSNLPGCAAHVPLTPSQLTLASR